MIGSNTCSPIASISHYGEVGEGGYLDRDCGRRNECRRDKVILPKRFRRATAFSSTIRATVTTFATRERDDAQSR